MSPFLKVMQLFLMMTATVLGMLVLLLVTPDLEETMLRVVRHYTTPRYRVPTQNNIITVEPQLDPHVPGISMGIEVDRNRKTFVPWPSSEECSRYRIHFARQKSLPMTALVSFPGSGNTWVRYLLETASGVFTGSVYIDRRIISKGFYGEAVPPDCGCTAVQKTHGFALEGSVPARLAQRTAEVKLFRGRGILLLRNPYEALLSYRNFLYGGHTGFAPHSQFKGPEWERFASQLAVVWKELAATWINYTRGHEAMVLHFETLRLNPHHDLSRLLDYLGISVDEQRIGCVLNHIDGPFRRPQSSQKLLFSSRDPFSEKLHRILDAVIHDLDSMLEKRGWDRIPIHLYKFYKQNST
ncbi:WSC domain-containing protein 2-like isoform X1 [Cryptotermes secundus]|uniref:WSC domain-containing protein 2-like isoform X1 n=2 Tax=Cryptotermes secundus TaxID=105785 RepID=UPI000CD7DD4A|nr:WSC domain-containing protein 2-like isoform X1 [Cryptotermes secundus]